MKKSGFTLVEITVVLLIAGIAAAAVTLKMAGPISRVRLDDVRDRVVMFDENTRSYARQQDKALMLKINIKDGSIERVDMEEKQVGRPLQLPGGFRFENCVVMSQDGPAEAASINFSRQGFCRSYAIKIANKSQSRWILVIGLTGQAIELDNEQKVQEIMETLSRNNPD